ncbi:MAG: hypothetical protein QOJ46_841 [bacterium]
MVGVVPGGVDDGEHRNGGDGVAGHRCESADHCCTPVSGLFVRAVGRAGVLAGEAGPCVQLVGSGARERAVGGKKRIGE